MRYRVTVIKIGFNAQLGETKNETFEAARVYVTNGMLQAYRNDTDNAPFVGINLKSIERFDTELIQESE
jgi:hypothetical protein